MVTQITLKTEGPHGLPSGRQTEADPLYRGLIILTDYDCGQRFTLERTEPCANATTRERGGRRTLHEHQLVVGPSVHRAWPGTTY